MLSGSRVLVAEAAPDCLVFVLRGSCWSPVYPCCLVESMRTSLFCDGFII